MSLEALLSARTSNGSACNRESAISSGQIGGFPAFGTCYANISLAYCDDHDDLLCTTCTVGRWGFEPKPYPAIASERQTNSALASNQACASF